MKTLTKEDYTKELIKDLSHKMANNFKLYEERKVKFWQMMHQNCELQKQIDELRKLD